MAFTIAVILVSMFHLFTVTWATQNAHIRAREAVLHDTTNLDAGRLGYTTPQSSPWSGPAGGRSRPFDTVPQQVAAPVASMAQLWSWPPQTSVKVPPGGWD